jgi:large subunit ribosomal protein L4
MSSSIVVKEFDLSSNSVNDISLSNFNVGNYSDELVHLSLRNQLLSSRSSSAKVKSMSEISGTTAKPFKQKGTGNARQGSKRSVQMRGGRSCFGPTGLENHNRKTLKEISKKSISLLISNKIKGRNLYCFKNFSAIEKTSEINNFLNDNNLKKVLFLVDKSPNSSHKKFYNSVANISGSDVVDFRSISPYLLLKFDKIIVDSSVAEKIIKKYTNDLS